MDSRQAIPTFYPTCFKEIIMNKLVVIAKKASFWEVVDGKQKRISKARFDAIMAQKVVKTEKREAETVYHVEEREMAELHNFAELSEVVQNDIIENNRYVNVADVDWFEYLKDDFHHTLELLGFSDITSNFSGFYNQGDGASFEARWDARNIVNDAEKWQSLKAYEYFKPYLDELNRLGGTAEVERISGSRYVHEYTCFVDADNQELEGTLEQLRIDCCTKYYRILLAEYEYLTSDDAVKDYLTSCDWLKYTKNGLRVN